jgi:hypothetical protein
MSRDNSAGTATGWTAGVRVLLEERFSLVRIVQTGSWAHRASDPMGTGGDFPGVKRPGREADHSHPSSAKAKNGGAIPPLPHMFSWHNS